MDGNTVESVTCFVYLGSLQSSGGQCRPGLTRRIGLACAAMTSLKRIWRDKRLTLDTKISIYQTLVLSVLLYAADTWTLLSANVRTLDALHQKCLRQLLGIRWYDRVRNDEVLQRTGLTSLSHILSRRRISVFGHVTRLDDVTPANMALQFHINVSLNRPFDRTWRRSPGLPRNNWLDQLRNDSTRLIGDLWRRAVVRAHGSATMRRPSPATQR